MDSVYAGVRFRNRVPAKREHRRVFVGVAFAVMEPIAIKR